MLVRPTLLTAACAIGSIAMAVGSWWCAGLPTGWHTAPAGFVVFYLGLAAVLISWLVLGRLVLDDAAKPLTVNRFAVATALPLLAAAPFGRDLWAYAGQGNVVRHGLNPYTHGPSAVPGAFANEVAWRWKSSPTPYGPIWLRISHLADVLSANHPTIAVLLLRLPALAGLTLGLWALPRLTSRLAGPLGGSLSAGLWLGLASPLTVVLGIGGGHNDLLMLGLLLAGCAIATRPGARNLAVGAAVVGLGVLIKSPDAIGVAFTVPLWLHANSRERTLREIVRACVIAIAAAGVTVVLVNLACDMTFGWTSQVNSDAQWISWLSLPSALVLFGRLVAGRSPIKLLDGTLKAFRNAGEVLTVVVVVALWVTALVKLRSGRAQIICLAWALAAAALLAPSVQEWYYCWGLALAGLVVTRQLWLVLLAAVDVMFPIMTMPSGTGMESDIRAVPVILGSLALTFAVTVVRRPSRSRPDPRAHRSPRPVH